jgi:DNA polymerase-1
VGGRRVNTSPRFVSVQGDDPAWPFNRLVKAYLDKGWTLDPHRAGLNGAAQAAKGPCPCGQHSTAGRDFAFTEYPNGRVRVWSFTGCDAGVCLESLGLTHRDTQTGPDGQILPDDDVDPAAPHLAAIPEYPLGELAGPLADLAGASVQAGLPAALAGGAGLGALAAVCGPADLEIYDTWTVRPALWIPLIAPPGGGKTPAIKTARRKLRELDSAKHQQLREEMADWLAVPKKERGERPADQTRLIDDITIEMVARWLDRGDGTGALDTDELSDFLRSMFRYRKGGGTDAGRWLQLWSAEPWRYMRVGSGSELDLHIPRPVLTICGGIQPELLHLLGPDGDGLRPRWLPHVSPTADLHPAPGRVPGEWNDAIEALYQARQPRTWALSREALQAWQAAQGRWQAARKQPESPSTFAALAKSDEQCARIALVIAESLAPGQAGEIPEAAMTSAVAITDYALDCWRALPGHDSLSYSRKDDAINSAIDRLAAWIEQRGGYVTKREIRRHTPAGIRSTERLNEVLREYDKVYPGSVRAETPEDRADKDRSDGRYGTLVFAPRRGNGEDARTQKHSPGGLSAADNPPNRRSGEPPEDIPGQCDLFENVGTPRPADNPAADNPAADNPAAVLDPFHPGEVTVLRSFTDLEGALPGVLAAEAVGLDIETTGLDPLKADVRLVQLAIPGRAYVIDCYALQSWALAVQQVINRAGALVVHDGAFDLRHLVRGGLHLPADLGARIRDTALASRLLTAGDRKHWNALDEVVARHLDAGLNKSLQASDWSGELTEDQIRYAATDAAVLLPLRGKLGEELSRSRLGRAAAAENRCLPSMVWLMDSGAPFDLSAHSAAVAEIDHEVASLQEVLDQQVAEHGAGEQINYRSPKQLLEMFGRLGVEMSSTSEEALKKVDHPLAQLLLRYRAATKLQSTYGRPLAEAVAPDGRIHASFRQMGADPGRMSCTGPNLQQVPKAHGFRSMFRAPDGRKLIKADYSQIELRIAAEISQDTELLDAFQRGDDLHTLTAQRVLGKQKVGKRDRQAAKALNFGLLYGMGAARLREHAENNYGVTMTEQQAKDYRDKFFQAYTGLRKWHQSQRDGPVDTRTILGRRRLGVTRYTEKLNTPVQGSGADGLKLAMALLHERKDQAPAGTFPVLVVHDEIVIECPSATADEATDWLVTAMKDGMAEILRKIPVVVDTAVADTWEG